MKNSIVIFLRKNLQFSHLHFMQLFSVLFFASENMKKTLSKVAHNRPKFFLSVLPTGSKPAQISDLFHRNLPPRDFSIMTLVDSMYSNIGYQVFKEGIHNSRNDEHHNTGGPLIGRFL